MRPESNGEIWHFWTWSRHWIPFLFQRFMNSPFLTPKSELTWIAVAERKNGIQWRDLTILKSILKKCQISPLNFDLFSTLLPQLNQTLLIKSAPWEFRIYLQHLLFLCRTKKYIWSMGLRQIFLNFWIFIYKKVNFSLFFDLFLMIFAMDMLFYKPWSICPNSGLMFGPSKFQSNYDCFT